MNQFYGSMKYYFAIKKNVKLSIWVSSESHLHYEAWKKSESKGYILYHSIFMTCWQCNYGDEEQISGYLGLELEFGFGYKGAAWGNFFKGEVNCSVAFPSGSAVKNLPAMQETWVPSLVRKIPWKRSWLPTTVFLPGEFHGQRSYKESDMTEVTEHEHSSVFQLWW